MSAFMAVRARLREHMMRVHGRTFDIVWRDRMGEDASWSARVDLVGESNPHVVAFTESLERANTLLKLGEWTEWQASGECCLRRLCERYETVVLP